MSSRKPTSTSSFPCRQSGQVWSDSVNIIFPTFGKVFLLHQPVEECGHAVQVIAEVRCEVASKPVVGVDYLLAVICPP